MLSKAFAVLRLYTPTRTELGVVEAAELLQRPTSTVSRWLSAMSDAGFLDRDPQSGRYRVGLQLIGLSEIARRSTFVRRLAEPALRELTNQTQETSTLGILDGSEAFDAEVIDSPHVIRPAAFPGRRYPLHATAVGKALLAWLPEDEVRRRLPTRLLRYTPATITRVDEFLKELGRTREQGYATAWCEWAQDYVGIAAPARDAGGNTIAAFSIGAPVTRVSQQSLSQFAELLVGVTNRVSTALIAPSQREEFTAPRRR